MTPYYADDWLTVYLGDTRAVMAEMEPDSVNCVVTSPPYWGLRDYGTPGQIGLEPTPEAYVASLVAVFREIRRVLRHDGTVWLNLGDSYATSRPGSAYGWTNGSTSERDAETMAAFKVAGSSIQHGLKPKDRVMIPARVALALQADGWWLRDEIIWHKPNPMPSSVEDRTTPAHEMVYLLTKSARYAYDNEAIREPLTSTDDEYLRAGRSVRLNHQYGAVSGAPLGPSSFATVPSGRNKRSVWTVATQPYPDAHFATFPEALIEPMILAGCPMGGVVLDPFAGSGTTGLVAQRLSRRAVLIDLSAEYLGQILTRNRDIPLGLGA